MIEIAEVRPSRLAEYAAVAIAFEVTHRLTPPSSEHDGRASLSAEPVAMPYEKDYDALPGMSPTAWPSRFDLRDWGLLIATRRGKHVGGAAIAPSHAIVFDTEQFETTAVLWDLRVMTAVRRQGIGEALFRAAEQWTLRHGFHVLMVETQDVNVPACRLYERMGCSLLTCEPDAYQDAPGEARLIWERRLGSDPGGG